MFQKYFHVSHSKYKRQKCHELPETVCGWLPQMLALLERKTREGSFS